MKKFSIIFALAVFMAAGSFAQFTYQAANCLNLSGVYTDLGSLGSVIDTNYDEQPMNFSDDVSRAISIGFDFNFNNDVYNKFFLSTNGYIKLANNYSIPPDLYGLPPFSNLYDSNLIAPFYTHLDAGSLTPEYRYYTTGPVGSRICTIQFKNVHDVDFNTLESQYANMSFQIVLNEATNNIEFIYGSFTASSSPANALTEVVVGVIGNTSNDQSVNATKTSLTAWSGATFINGPYPGNYFNSRNSLLPDVGRKFCFIANPPPTNDAKVSYVYTLGEVPVGFGFPQRVSAVIKNNGVAAIDNLVVTMTVSGTNSHVRTKTISSLGAGISTTVQFDTFTSFDPGLDTVLVSVPSDDYDANNSKEILQNVGTEVFSYADDAPSFGRIGFGLGSGTMLTKYYMNGTANIRYVSVYISADLNNQNKKVRATLLNASGTIVGQSPDYYISAPDLDNWVTFEMQSPITQISDASFYAGLAQYAAQGDTAGYFPVSYQLESIPTRPGAYYQSALGGGGVTEVNSLGRFMIKAILDLNPLPVTFRSFSAQKNGKVNDIKWEINNELNVSKYILERSAQGYVFTTLASISATGNTTYTYSDLLPNRGMNYYRLRIVDKDGRESFSEIRSVRNFSDAEFVVFPNPVKEVANVKYVSSESGRATLAVYSTEGKLLVNQQVNLIAGSNTIKVATGNLIPGSYNLILTTQNNRFNSRFIRQ